VITLSKLNHNLHQQSAGCCYPLYLSRVFFMHYELGVIYFVIAISSFLFFILFIADFVTGD
jgi:hypothetical protein